MALSEKIEDELKAFLSETDFARAGAVVTDLDGTAVHEFEGRVVIPDPVACGLKRLNDLGRPIVLNTLRFPLNVIRTFGREWYAITNAPLPLVSLNGGVVGYLREDAAGEIIFEELDAFPLEAEEIDEVLQGVRGPEMRNPLPPAWSITKNLQGRTISRSPLYQRRNWLRAWLRRRLENRR